MPVGHPGHRAHPLGHARRADHAERPSAHRPGRPHRRHPQRHHRELERHPEGARGARPQLQVRDRHRGAGPPRGRVLPGQPRGGRGGGAARRRRRLRPGVHLRGRAGRARGRAEGLAPAGGRGRERVLRRLRRVAAAAVHPLGGLPRRRRAGGPHPRRLPGAEPPDDPHQQAGEPDRLGPGDGGAQRLPALHAEGDPRAAREPLQHAPRPPARRRGHRPRHRPQPERRRAEAGRADRHHRVRHLVAFGAHRRVHARGDGPDPGRGGVRLRVPLPEPGGGPADARHRDLAERRDRRHPGGRPRGQAAGRPDGRAGQRGGLDHRARSGRRHLPARRPRGGRRQHQGVHQPGGRARAGDAPAGPAPEPEHPAGAPVHRGAAPDCPSRSPPFSSARARSRPWPTGSSRAPRTRSISAAG